MTKCRTDCVLTSTKVANKTEESESGCKQTFMNVKLGKTFRASLQDDKMLHKPMEHNYLSQNWFGNYFANYICITICIGATEVRALTTILTHKSNCDMDLNWAEFERTEMRVGTIIEVKDFPEARKPAYQLTIDFGQVLGTRKSSAQITQRYQKNDLLQRQIIAVVNFPKKQIGNFMSECLVLGAVNPSGEVVLLAPDFKVENGSRIA